MQETFVDIKDYEGYYEAGDLGTIRRKNSKRTVKPVRGGRRHLTVQLCVNGFKTTKYVHRLIMESFNPSFSNKDYIYHIDKDITNNALLNLRVRLSTDGVIPPPNASKAVVQMDLKGNIIKEWPSMTQVRKELGFSQSTISSVCTGRRKTAHKHLWKFKEK